MSCSMLVVSRPLCRGWTGSNNIQWLGCLVELSSIFGKVPVELTDLKDLSKVCVSVGEHGVDAVDGILGLARRASLRFGLQYRHQDTRGSGPESL